MRPRELLGEARTPDGRVLTLHAEASGHVIRVGNEVLMSSRSRGSEEELAAAALAGSLRSAKPRVLVGGLGMGFTLRAVLDRVPPTAEVVVAELLDAIVEWNRGVLAPLAHNPLDDRRVRLFHGDVGRAMAAPGGYDAILLDVDNGPDAMTAASNASLYGPRGLAAAHAALRPGGALAVWSASAAPSFLRALARAGFAAEEKSVPARAGGGGRHTIFLGRVSKGTSRTRPPRPGSSSRN